MNAPDTVAIVDYGSGNLRSVAKAFERVIGEQGYRCRALVTANPETVATAARVVLPGVGAFGDCRRGLFALDGMTDAMTHAVRERGRPFLGICVGMQLMMTVGKEHGHHDGLGWIDGVSQKIITDDPSLKIPHMGWNTLTLCHMPHPHPVLQELHDGVHVYYVHSYETRPLNPATVLATSPYGGTRTAVIGCENMIGTQFHPEKSQAVGLKLIDNFLRWSL